MLLNHLVVVSNCQGISISRIYELVVLFLFYSSFDNNNNNIVYLIKCPYKQDPFKGTVQMICNIIIPK